MHTTQGVLTSLATFTFTTTFKANTPFAHLLPSWSDLIWHPFDTLGQAITVYKMDVEHKTIQAEEKRLQKFGDAYRQHRYRVAHGIKDGPEIGPEADVFVDRKKAVEDKVQQKEEEKRMEREHEHEQGEYVDFEGNRKPVKKWLGIW